jgi:L-threonylcarbamoyladenylate synthase
MKTLLISASDPESILLALQVIKKGGVVAFPTDTVYGIGASAFSAEGIGKLFLVKGRDAAKAIPVLIGDSGQLDLVTASINLMSLQLAEYFWPGPLTLVVARHPALPEVLSPLPTIGVRMPDHPVALALLCQSGPLATTSANLSGGPNPSTAQEVMAQLDGRIDLIIDGGICPGGIPSTVLDCTSSELHILRQGPLSLEDLKRALSRD